MVFLPAETCLPFYLRGVSSDRRPHPSEIMGEDEENSLPELTTSAPDVEQTRARQLESKRTKISVLVGSGIIQLPIWGTL